MIGASKITDIDWENPDVIQLFEVCNGKFVPLEKEVARLNTVNANLNAENIEQRNRIIELEQLLHG